MADYNRWMNAKVYRSAETLSDADLQVDRGAFFSSILGTLNHILVADTVWLKRFANHPARFSALQSMHQVDAPSSLTLILHTSFSDLANARRLMDESIIQFCAEASDDDYSEDVHYTNTEGQPFVNEFGMLVQHFFNHQTHHRGQATTLLSQSGLDVGTTDLVMMLRERSTR